MSRALCTLRAESISLSFVLSALYTTSIQFQTQLQSGRACQLNLIYLFVTRERHIHSTVWTLRARSLAGCGATLCLCRCSPAESNLQTRCRQDERVREAHSTVSHAANSPNGIVRIRMILFIAWLRPETLPLQFLFQSPFFLLD